MAIKHAEPGEVIDLKTYGGEKTDTHTIALMKAKHFETVRLFIRAGSTVPPHKVNGPIAVHCLRGDAVFFVKSEPRALRAGNWLHIEGGKVHTIEARTDCVLLVTIIFVAANEDLHANVPYWRRVCVPAMGLSMGGRVAVISTRK
ncbi:MAG: cupin [Candidatus Hydrogenedentes bacterium]|nr:cupin [Candidatus Hydrogenedentota bacterium]